MLKANMVNPESRCVKLPEFWQKLLDSGRFLYFKTTVKYNRRFSVNGETVHFSGRRRLTRNAKYLQTRDKKRR
jgi:hypothetical protein